MSTRDDWKQLIEVFYRRNIVVHNQGLVDETYRLKTGYKDEGNVILTDSKYIVSTIELMRLYANYIADEFKKKYSKQ